MMNLRAHYSTRNTPQDQPIPSKNQVKNNAGGYAFAIDDWSRLDRFLVLGTAGGTFYVGEQKLTIENAECVARCIAEDGRRVVGRIVEISEEGRAPKNDPALFALAMCAAAEDQGTRQAALDALPKVARIGTHLFHFAEYVEGFRGWGRALKNAIARWYTEMPLEKLALQVVKYRQRDGWSHRDLLRLAHPKAAGAAKKAMFDYACRDTVTEALPELIRKAENVKGRSAAEVAAIIREAGLPREVVPTELLNSVEVWHALLEDMPVQAMVRNQRKGSCMKRYVGERTPDGVSVVVIPENGEAYELSPRFDLRNHSPDGFEFGYAGSGPSQLSLALLADALGDDDRAQDSYQSFKFKVIGRLTGERFELTDEEIDQAVTALEAERGRGRA